MFEVKAVGTIARMWADNMGGKFFDSFLQLFAYEQSKLKSGQYIHYEKATVSWQELGRNSIVQNTLGDWLLMLDTDHVFAPDLLERLTRLKKKYNAQVISGIYQYKFAPHPPVANMWKETEKGLKVVPIVAWDKNDEIIQIGSCGAGCLLADTSVYHRIKKELNEEPFSIIPGLSEDYSFFYRCRKLGIPVYLAPKVECHHTFTGVLHINDYQMPTAVTPVKTENGTITSLDIDKDAKTC